MARGEKGRPARVYGYRGMNQPEIYSPRNLLGWSPDPLSQIQTLAAVAEDVPYNVLAEALGILTARVRDLYGYLGKYRPATDTNPLETWLVLDEEGRDEWAEWVASRLDDRALLHAIAETMASRGPLAIPRSASQKAVVVNYQRAEALAKLRKRRGVLSRERRRALARSETVHGRAVDLLLEAGPEGADLTALEVLPVLDHLRRYANIFPEYPLLAEALRIVADIIEDNVA